MSRLKKLFFTLCLSIIIVFTGNVVTAKTIFKDHDFLKNSKIENFFTTEKNGLKGEYFSNVEFKGNKVTRVDYRISFDWGTGSPAWIVSRDKFSVRWTGQILPAYSEEYTFHAIADDGVRLWVNNTLIIDAWNNSAATEYKGTISLNANKKYNIIVEYFENRDDACVKLLWSSSRQQKEIIPKNRLFPKIGSTVMPTATPSPTPVPTPAPTVLIQTVTQDLTENFNQDAFSYDNDRSDGNFDGANNTYPAELIAKDFAYDGIHYVLGSFANDNNNSIGCIGQTINITRGRYVTIRLAGSATNGSKTGIFKINYTDGTYSTVAITMKDWCASDTSGERVLQTMAHRHTTTQDSNGNCYIYLHYLPTDSSKTVSSITLPNLSDMHILAATLVPNSIVNTPEVGNGLLGEYFDDMDLTDSSLARIDPFVSFDWGTGSPDSSMGPNTFSVKWTGTVMPQYTETYTFYTIADDGVKLWVNNKLLINNWVEQAATEKSGTIALQAGHKYNIRLEYFEKTDKASVKLSWSSNSLAKQIIPQSQLFH